MNDSTHSERPPSFLAAHLILLLTAALLVVSVLEGGAVADLDRIMFALVGLGIAAAWLVLRLFRDTGVTARRDAPAGRPAPSPHLVPQNPVVLAAWLGVAWAAFLLLTSEYRWASFGALGLVYVYAVLLHALVQEWNGRTAKTYLAWGLAVSGIAIAFAGVGRQAMTQGLVLDHWPFYNRDDLAAWLSGSLGLCLGFAWERRGTQRWLLVAGSGLIGYAIVLTQARGAVIACLITAFLVLHLPGTKRPVWLRTVVPGLVLAVYVSLIVLPAIGNVKPGKFFAGGSLFDRELRLQMWQRSFRMFLDRPVFGFGPGTFPYLFPEYQGADISSDVLYPHNLALGILCEYGAVGLGLLGFLLWTYYRTVRADLRQNQRPYHAADGPGSADRSSARSLAESAPGNGRGNGARAIRPKKSYGSRVGIKIGAAAGLTAMLLHSLVSDHFRAPGIVLFALLLVYVSLSSRGADEAPGWAGRAVAALRRIPRPAVAISGLVIILLLAVVFARAGSGLTHLRKAWNNPLHLENARSIAEFEKAIRVDGGHAVYYTELGELYFQTWRDTRDEAAREGAAKAYAQAVEKNPYDAQANDRLGSLAFLSGRREEAISHYRRAAELLPFDVSKRTRLAHVYMLVGDKAAAYGQIHEAHMEDAESVEKVLRFFDEDKVPPRVARTMLPPEPAALMPFARQLELAGNWEEARKDYGLLCARFPRNKGFFDAYMTASLANGAPGPAIQLFRQRLAVRLEGYTWEGLGDIYLRARDVDAAAEAFKIALKDNAESVSVMTHLAELAIRNNDWKQAGEWCDKALAAAPYEAQTHYLKGQLLARESKVAESVIAYRKAVTLAPAAPQYSLNLARVYEARGSILQALAVLESLLALVPEQASAWEMAARIHERQGETEQAIFSWRKVIEIRGQDEAAADALMRLVTLKTAAGSG